MFALLSYLGSGHIYDAQANQWHVYEIDATVERVDTWDGAHGGLVWFLSRWSWQDNEPRFFYVMNSLTKQKKRLPPFLSMAAKKSNTLETTVRIVKLTVDKKTKTYKVFIVGSIRDGDRSDFAQVYDSYVKE